MLDYEGEEENYFSEDIIDEMVNNKFVVSMKEKPLFYGAFGDDVSTIGGFASWVQDWEYRDEVESGTVFQDQQKIYYQL